MPARTEGADVLGPSSCTAPCIEPAPPPECALVYSLRELEADVVSVFFKHLEVFSF